MFPATVKIIRTLRPKAFILENVKGLTRASFANYFQYILLQLEFPEVTLRKAEAWNLHFERLQREKSSGGLHFSGLTYNVLPTLVNAADFGIPQKRERVFMVGFRSDLDVHWNFPGATHSEDALLHDQWVTGKYPLADAKVLPCRTRQRAKRFSIACVNMPRRSRPSPIWISRTFNAATWWWMTSGFHWANRS